MAHDSQKVQANEHHKYIHVGPSQRQASGTNQLIKALREGHHWIWGLALLQLKMKLQLPAVFEFINYLSY